MKLLTILFLSITLIGNSQNPSHSNLSQTKVDTLFKRDTIIIRDTVILKNTIAKTRDTINQILLHSDYNKLYEQVLDQKQEHYDSTLNGMMWISGIFGVLITILVFLMGFLGYNSIESIRNSLKNDFNTEKDEIGKKIKAESDKVATLKYETEITEIKEKMNNLESFAIDLSNSFTLKRGKEKPDIRQVIKMPKKSTNPFDKTK